MFSSDDESDANLKRVIGTGSSTLKEPTEAVEYGGVLHLLSGHSSERMSSRDISNW